MAPPSRLTGLQRGLETLRRSAGLREAEWNVLLKALPIVLVFGVIAIGTLPTWQESITVVGDASCEGAEIRIDGHRAGRLDKRVEEPETVLASGLREWWGDESDGDTLWIRGDHRYEASVRVTLGRHRIEIASRDGREVWDEMRVCEYSLVKVSFARMRIRCQSECSGDTTTAAMKQF